MNDGKLERQQHRNLTDLLASWEHRIVGYGQEMEKTKGYYGQGILECRQFELRRCVKELRAAKVHTALDEEDFKSNGAL